MNTSTPGRGYGNEVEPSVLRRRSHAAVARSTVRDRSLAVLVGLVLLAGGTLVALLSWGVFGEGRASRPLIDPMIVDALRAQPLAGRAVAIVGGLLLAVLGVVWAARSLRPERHPDLVLDGGQGTSIVVSSAAVAEAVTAQACVLPGVGRARTRLVGTEAAPALRVTLWLADDADVRDVLARIDEVLATARSSLDVTALPTAVRLERDVGHPAPRVT